MLASRDQPLQAGVVTGDSYQKLVENCKDKGFALAAVNVTSTSTLNAVLEAAAEARTDVVIQLSNGGARFFAGKGLKNDHRAKVLGAVSAARHTHLLAKHYGICVVLHTDHANRVLIPWIEDLMVENELHYAQTGQPLFSSHMIDLSEEPISKNLKECHRLLPRMAKIGVSLEMELGVTGGEEDGIGQDLDRVDNAKLYTQPEDVLLAYQTLQPLGHFSIAASFGNVHGVYRPGNVQLRPEILKRCQSLISEQTDDHGNILNLVFHGGSGSDKAQITEAIGYGVFKMNIDTDTQFAYAKGAADFMLSRPKAFQMQIDNLTGEPYKKYYDPRAWMREAETHMKKRLFEAFSDLGCEGKTLARP